jgi:Holliday junction resolvasome RuvABC endonuclease subunit
VRGTRDPATVVGLDLSLTRPAACAIPHDWEIGKWRDLAWTSLETEPVENEHDRIVRIIKIVGHVRDFALVNRASNCFVEQYAFSRRSSSVTKLAELGGHARVEFLTYGRMLQTVVASQARKLLIGKLPPKNAKVMVQQALYAHGAPFPNDDVCDAFVVANWGRSELGLTALSLA